MNASDFKNVMLSLNASRSMLEFAEYLEQHEYEKAEQSAFMHAVDWLLDKNRETFRDKIKKGTILYRSRCLDKLHLDKLFDKGLNVDASNKVSGFDEFNSREPSIFIASPGRNNTNGQSYLYLAEDEYTACCEVKPTLHALISVAKFRLQSEMNIINFDIDQKIIGAQQFERDFNMNPARFFTIVMQLFASPVTSIEEYTITQLISNQIRKAGLDGICYRSAFSGKRNYTIFNSHPKNIKWIDSRVVYFQSTCLNFIDISTSELLYECENELNQQQIDEYSKGAIEHIKRMERKSRMLRPDTEAT